MNLFLRSAFAAALLSGHTLPSLFCGEAGSSKTRSRAHLEVATRLQVFLDRAEFAPGKIDGRYGEFTLKALALYRQARGGESAPSPAKGGRKRDAGPDLSGLDLASIDPLFISYTVTKADLQNTGEVPAARGRVAPVAKAAVLGGVRVVRTTSDA